MSNSSDKYYMSLVKIKDINALIDSKSFFDQPGKRNKKRIKKLVEIMTMQQETYQIVFTIKNIIILLVWIYHGNKYFKLFIIFVNCKKII